MRPKKRRCCRKYNADRIYKPKGIPLKDIETTELSLDQFEAIRLCDGERLEQDEAGRRMGISRGTIQRLLYSGRQQIVNAILKNDAILEDPAMVRGVSAIIRRKAAIAEGNKIGGDCFIIYSINLNRNGCPVRLLYQIYFPTVL